MVLNWLLQPLISPTLPRRKLSPHYVGWFCTLNCDWLVYLCLTSPGKNSIHSVVKTEINIKNYKDMKLNVCGGFLKWGVPPNHPCFFLFFHYKPCSYWTKITESGSHPMWDWSPSHGFNAHGCYNDTSFCWQNQITLLVSVGSIDSLSAS
jgi:hypothetical protein